MHSGQRPGWAASRRETIKLLGGLGLFAALGPCARGLPGRLAQAQPRDGAPRPTTAITRPIPGTNERVPVVGLGTFMTFDLVPGRRREHIREVMRRFWEGGGRVFDTSPLYGMAEVNVGDFATSLGINDQMFVANKIWSTGEFLADDSHARRSLETSMQRLWRQQIDLMQCHSLVNADVILPLLQAWKKEGRIRYVGASHHEPAYFGPLADWVERGDLDFVQVNYSIHARSAEQRVLPAAAARGAAVLVNMPFAKARLFKIVKGRPLPDFAREIGVESWAQFFLKWVISHPAVTCVLPATANPDHVVDNLGAMRGPLPDQKMRVRMARHVETLPGFDTLTRMPWYPNKRYPGIISRARDRQGARR